MPQNRKALTSIEQTGDRRTKVPLACVERFFLYVAMEMNLLEIDKVKECIWQSFILNRYKITYFKKLIDATTRNIVGTQYR